MNEKPCFEWIGKRGLLAAIFLLSACAPAQQASTHFQGQSVILAAVEINPDFSPGIFQPAPSSVYSLNLRLQGDAGSRETIRPLPLIESLDTRSRWLAFPVPPGTYTLAGVVEEGHEGDFRLDRMEKSTWFTGASVAPRFDVGPGEVVYVGTFRAQIGTDFGKTLGQIGGRFLRDARKTYTRNMLRARDAARRYRIADKPLRDIDIFSKSPDAFAK
jgi:hypothetical protein